MGNNIQKTGTGVIQKLSDENETPLKWDIFRDLNNGFDFQDMAAYFY